MTPNSEYPLDLYILMDLSYSMQDDLDMIRLLLGDLSKCMYLNYIPCHHYFQYTRSLHKQIELPIDKVHEVLIVQLSCKCDLYLGAIDVVH